MGIIAFYLEIIESYIRFIASDNSFIASDISFIASYTSIIASDNSIIAFDNSIIGFDIAFSASLSRKTLPYIKICLFTLKMRFIDRIFHLIIIKNHLK